MILHTTDTRYLGDYRLFIAFNNGESGEVNMEHELWGEVFEPLKDKALFATARHDPELGTVVWANGADFAPEHLLDLMHRQRKEVA